jgi:hypothetical protein
MDGASTFTHTLPWSNGWGIDLYLHTLSRGIMDVASTFSYTLSPVV